MHIPELNYLAVLVSGVVLFMLGGLWYSPAVFGKAWMRENGFKEEDMKNSNMVKIFGLAFLLAVISAINLAIAIAADMGRTALLVDLDLRKPSIHRRFGFEPGYGVDDCLQEQLPVIKAMVKVQAYDRLTILPARKHVANSSELIASQTMIDLMAELRTRYANRVLIFDLPPVLVADDALAFSAQVQAGLFVVAEGRTSRDSITRSLNLLHGLPIVGTVLNNSSETPGEYY